MNKLAFTKFARTMVQLKDLVPALLKSGVISTEGGLKAMLATPLVLARYRFTTTIKVQDPKGKVIFTGKLDKNGELTFKKPKGEFTVTFDGGPGHSVTIKSSNIK